MKRTIVLLALAVLTVVILSSSADANCSQGYWKNHPEDWCVTSLQLGDVSYDQEQLLDIFNLEVEGNGLVSLAHQLIAAKLNVACGTEMIDEIADADAMVGSLVVPPVGSGYLPTSMTSDLNYALDEYNNLPYSGGFVGCETVAVEEFSWGKAKANYR